jgi:endonuclease/exonuclease/phosphatase family metal-dependent hydrolase
VISSRALGAVLAFLLFWTVDASAQVAPLGSAERLDVATWNIEWFGSTSNGPTDLERQFNNVRAIIEGAEVDLWGVQEIASPALFQTLLDSLGDGYSGALASYTQTQKIGFIYRNEVVDRVSVGHILESFNYEFAGRPPLEMRTTVTLPDTSLSVTFITVHLKCCNRTASDYERRQESSTRLKNHIDFLRANQAVVVLGDFNDRVTTSTRSGFPSPFENILDDTQRYRFVTYEAEARGEHSYIGSPSLRSMIDHILITHPLFNAYVEESARAWEELPAILWNYDRTSYVSHVSDHLPVYAGFDFRTVNSADELELPAITRIDGIYPNPSYGPLSVQLTLERASHVTIDVVDLAGRTVATLQDGILSQGASRISGAVENVASGMYFVRVVTDGQRSVRPIAIVR